MKFSNRDRLRRKLAALPDIARQEIRQELDKRAREVSEMARGFAPADDGHLKRSIGYTFGDYKPANSNVRGVGGGGKLKDSDLTVTVHAGDEKAYYAAWVEFGTAPHAQPNNWRIGFHHPGASAHPFFFPAYRLSKKRVKSGISRATRRAAKKVISIK